MGWLAWLACRFRKFSSTLSFTVPSLLVTLAALLRQVDYSRYCFAQCQPLNSEQVRKTLETNRWRFPDHAKWPEAVIYHYLSIVDFPIDKKLHSAGCSLRGARELWSAGAELDGCTASNQLTRRFFAGWVYFSMTQHKTILWQILLFTTHLFDFQSIIKMGWWTIDRELQPAHCHETPSLRSWNWRPRCIAWLLGIHFDWGVSPVTLEYPDEILRRRTHVHIHGYIGEGFLQMWGMLSQALSFSCLNHGSNRFPVICAWTIEQTQPRLCSEVSQWNNPPAGQIEFSSEPSIPIGWIWKRSCIGYDQTTSQRRYCSGWICHQLLRQKAISFAKFNQFRPLAPSYWEHQRQLRLLPRQRHLVVQQFMEGEFMASFSRTQLGLKLRMRSSDAKTHQLCRTPSVHAFTNHAWNVHLFRHCGWQKRFHVEAMSLEFCSIR